MVVYRELVVSSWRIVYRIAGEEVYVLAMLHVRRDVEQLLLERVARSVGDT